MFPLKILSSCSAFIASFTVEVTFKVRSLIVREASPSSPESPDLMPFLPLAVTVSVPLPHSHVYGPKGEVEKAAPFSHFRH